jgi:predicted P-loop ATPase
MDVGLQKPTKQVYGDLENEVDQIWAEAVELWNNKEPLHLNREELKEAEKQQDSHSEESAKAGLIEEYLNKTITDNWYNLGISEKRNYIQGSEFGEVPEGTTRRDKTCVMEIWVELFNGDPKQLTPMTAREINDILSGFHEWEKYKGKLRFGKSYGIQRAFIRKF